MWHLIIPTILYLTYGEAYNPSLANYPFLLSNEHNKLPENPTTYPYTINPGAAPYTSNVLPRQNADYTGVPAPFPHNYPSQRLAQYVDDPYYNGSPYNRIPRQYGYYSRNGDNLLQSESQSQSRAGFGAEVYLIGLDSSSSDSDSDTDPKSLGDRQSYFEDLELVEDFGHYLKQRTYLDGSSVTINDPAHQYNALLAVLLGLAEAVKNSCNDFDKVYDKVYLSTVDTYYRYGLNNAERVASVIEDYTRKGNSNIPKLRKLKQELCKDELFCAERVNNKINSSPLLYVRELETLEALAHLARSYYSYIDEFNQAAQKGEALRYLQNSKDRLREYVMHVVNSVEHLDDKAVRCS